MKDYRYTPRSPVAMGLLAMKPGDNFIFAAKDASAVRGIIQSYAFAMAAADRKFPMRSHPIGFQVTCAENYLTHVTSLR